MILSLSSLMNEVVHTSPTIGSNVEEIVVKNTHFLMWDIGGQESLRSSWNTYYSNTEVSNMFWTLFAFWHMRGTEVLSCRGYSGSWCVCSEHRRQRGPPKSEVSLSQRGRFEKQSEGQPPQCVGGEERGESWQRQMCERQRAL